MCLLIISPHPCPPGPLYEVVGEHMVRSLMAGATMVALGRKMASGETYTSEDTRGANQRRGRGERHDLAD